MKPSILFLLLSMCLLTAGCGLNSNTKNAAKKAIDNKASHTERFNAERQAIEEKLKQEAYADARVSWQKKLADAQTQFDKYVKHIEDVEAGVKKDNDDLSLRILSHIQSANDARFKAFNELKPMQDMVNLMDRLAEDKEFAVRRAELSLKSITEASAKPAYDDIVKASEKFPGKKKDLEKLRKEIEQDIKHADQIKADLSVTSLFKLAVAIKQAEQASAQFSERLKDARDRCKQLDESWTKILVDMNIKDNGNNVVFKHQYLLVRINQAGETTQEKRWSNVSESIYQKHEKHLGLSIAQKPIGSFEEESIDIPQPPGYAYIAEPGESNTYGEWRRNHHGSSYWYFYPRYGYMSGLFWGRGYGSNITDRDYNNYRSNFNSGRTYFGPPGRCPAYGTDGSVTRSGFSNASYYSSDNVSKYNTFRRTGGSASRDGGFANSRFSTTGNNRIVQRSRSSSSSSSGYGSRSAGGK